MSLFYSLFRASLGFAALNINTTNTFRDIAMSILITQYPFIPTEYDTTPTRRGSRPTAHPYRPYPSIQQHTHHTWY